MSANSFDFCAIPTYNAISGNNHKKHVSKTMADTNSHNIPASERTGGVDFSSSLVAARRFQELIPMSTLTHYIAFMTIYELCKGSPTNGIDLRTLPAYLATGEHRDKPAAKTTVSRIVRILSENEKAWSYQKSDQNFGLLRILSPDGRSKSVTITEKGHEVAREMADAEKVTFERDYLDSLMDSIEAQNDYSKSPEMKYVAFLFDQGFDIEQVEEKVEIWRKRNPDKVFQKRGDQYFDVPVPEGVTDKWLEKYQNTTSDEERERMLKDAGLFADETMQSMMFTVEPSAKRNTVTFSIPRSMTRTKNGQKRSMQFVNRIRKLRELSDNKWDMSKVVAWEMDDTRTGKLSRMTMDKVLTGKSADQRSDIAAAKDQQIDDLRSEVADLKAIVQQFMQQKVSE